MVQRLTIGLALLALTSGCPADEDGESADASSMPRHADAGSEDADSGSGDSDIAMTPGMHTMDSKPSAGSGGARVAQGGAGGSDVKGPRTGPSSMGGTGGTGTAGMRANAAGADAKPVDAAPTVSDEIETVAFERAQNGNPTPLVLFKGGYACRDKNIVEQNPIDAAAHRAANPNQWLQWRRRTDGTLEVKQNNGPWSELPYSFEYEPLAPGTSLSGLHEWYFTPDPNAETLVLLVWRYRFHTDGTFEYCYTSTITGDPSVPVFSKKREQRQGKYRVDGYTIHLDDDAGMSDVQSFFFDSHQSSDLWIDSRYMYLNDKTDQSLCD